MDIHGKALDSMMNDMDDMESKKLFGTGDSGNMGGVSVTISVTPNGEADGEKEPDGDEAMMNKGGMACYNEGGIVPESEETDLTLPPFLRKKKKFKGM